MTDKTETETIPSETLDAPEAAQETPETVDPETPDANTDGTTPPEEAQQKKQLGNDTKKRIARLTYEREQARRETAALQEMVAKMQGDDDSGDNIDAQVETRVSQRIAQQTFNDECNATYEKGTKEFPDFSEAIRSFDDIGGLADRTEFLDAVNSLENGAAVLRHLGKNIDEAASLFDLKPAKMAIKLATISGNLAKPKPNISNTPAPPGEIRGGAVSGKNPENMSMDEFAKWFEEKRQARR